MYVQIVEGVHAAKSYIYCQLWALGRTADEKMLKEDDPSFSVVGPSPIAVKEGAPIPRELTIPEIQEYIQSYATAARNAVHEAQFDGVEIHSANGYLIDQFLQDVSNQRQDEYGGSVERRSRFGLEVVRAVVGAVGTAKKVGIRLSPWSPFNGKKPIFPEVAFFSDIDLQTGMSMQDPVPQFSHFVTALKQEFPGLAYIHVVEARIAGGETIDVQGRDFYTANDFLRAIWSPRTYISAGGYDRQSAMQRSDEGENELVAFGRQFISNVSLSLDGLPSLR